MRRRVLCLIILYATVFDAYSQAPPAYNSADIYLRLEKLKVLGSVLYIAAHPDDENTRLLAWLSKERLYRTGYLSLTRGDGGQNLIGDEQGVELGLIRTQELLAARRIDGAEQFFSRAFDFGFTKTTEEALKTWDKDKILGDVVWVIRKFQPDIIITRFPEDQRAGHGQHSGSAVLAHEAFRAAADPNQFPDQFKFGVKPWQAKRILWNTFNFGNTNTTSEDQLKIDVGGFNPILGKSYGEIAADSRSEHKSQGFGVPGSRGRQLEYFSFVEGDRPDSDLMDKINTSWSKIPGGDAIAARIDSTLTAYSLRNPENSVRALVKLYDALDKLPDSYWKNQKMKEVLELIEMCSGLWLEATAGNEYAVQGDSVRFSVNINNRLGSNARLLSYTIGDFDSTLNKPLEANRNYFFSRNFLVSPEKPISQPYWLEQKMNEGMYNVTSQQMIGKPWNDPAYQVSFVIDMEGSRLRFHKPVMYKYTDPVRGELYEPLVVVPPLAVSAQPGIVLFRKYENQKSGIYIKLSAHRNLSGYQADITARMLWKNESIADSSFSLSAGQSRQYDFTLQNSDMKAIGEGDLLPMARLKKEGNELPQYLNITSIRYNHIPNIHYFYADGVKVLNLDLKTAGKKIGYIEGAGDKIPQALEQMGYEVTILREKDITTAGLRAFDAVITGVRAYNVQDFLSEKYDVLMGYVKEGGNLVVQYNTSNFISSVKSKIGPFSFAISRNRVTDEHAPVRFLLPDHPVLNYPNKISTSDFDGWVQERGIYFADNMDPHYQAPLGMADANESEQKGSLIIADYGRGKFVYTGLVFFRELPAGVPGAYRLLANILALSKKKAF